MSTDDLTLDEAGLARLEQVLVGLLPPSALPVAARYVDPEGNPVATRDGDEVTALRPSRWVSPAEARTAAPVVVAVADEVPVGPLPSPDAVLLLPLGGARADDTRLLSWAQAWRSVAGSIIDVPVEPHDATSRSEQIAAAYSTGPLLTVSTVPQPLGEGRVVFFTGLSGSGKSTVARELVARLASDRSVTLLDGDVVRTHLSKGLGFSRADRDVNIRRIGWVAAEVAKHGGIAVCAPIAPYDEARQWTRAAVERSAGRGAFVLVWVATPVEVCEARDVKGLYAKARAGELVGFTGVDDPYEPPVDADVVVDTSQLSVDEAVDAVLSELQSR